LDESEKDMIISHEHKYIFVGIPRNASKSVSQWLVKNCKGKWHGAHHQWKVPDECRGYLVFAVVRNPYERAASGMFGMHWGNDTPDPMKRVSSQKPPPFDESLSEQILKAELTGNATMINEGTTVPEVGMNQSHFIQKAGVSLVLYYERLPMSLADLPFVDGNALPDLPRALEKGIRPPGTFFDHFTKEDEQVTWAYASEDFEMLGYRRYDAMLPDELPNSLRI
jgi:hypothetical protein